MFLPGAALSAFVLVVAPVLAAHGMPRVWAVLGGILFVLAPLQLALVHRHRLSGPLLGRGTLRGRRLVLASVLTAAASAVLPAAGLPLEQVVPGWADVGLGSLAGATPTTRWATVLLWVVAAVVVGPLVEEAWFRGCVQPRIPGGPWSVPLRSAALFAGYHLWQPQAVLTVFLFALPLCVLVQRTRATGVAAGVHVVVNALAGAGSAVGLLTR